MKNSCLIIAGEKSGEDHAMSFFKELRANLGDCEFYGVGGSELEKEDVELLYHLKEFSGIGLSEILSKIPFYLKAMRNILAEVDKRQTKTAILIDFQGFNLKLAKKLKKRGVRVLYYVAPQAWVWKPWRSKVLEKNVHTLFTILPFEKEWFKSRGVSKIKSVMHPLMVEYSDEVNNVELRRHNSFSERKLKLLLLPGSRNVEVSKLLPIFLAGVKLLREAKIDLEIGIVTSDSVREENYGSVNGDEHKITKWESHDLVSAMNWADMAIAASGTVTLATGLFQLPTIVCYQVSLFTEFVLGMAIPYKGPISLTNIIHNEMIFPELVQYKADRYNISKSIKKWFFQADEYNAVVDKLVHTKEKLSGDSFDLPKYMAEVIES